MSVDFEKLGAFYLGRHYDLSTGRRTDVPVLYDSKDLVTHALIVGMTGSGKTGLGIGLIEEAVIDAVPAIVIDPKGDLTNLLLTFPDLRASDFEPWVNEDDARRAGQSRAEFAAGEAARWGRGLAEWGQDGARIRRLKDAGDWTIYTPGSTIGAPVSVLGSFAPDLSGDPEIQRERVQTTASSLLALAGVESDPLKGREHILLATIIGAAWQAGETLDLAALVHRVQTPPMTRVGVIDLDSFFPPQDRFELAMSLNALLASPGFDAWTRGVPLDIAAMLRTASGKPRVAIFSLAHLGDAYRMFFVSMLLTAVSGWMRAQSGTSSLRALLYMDEIFGFFPPVANPPSKGPLLTLLKQGRAAGLGVVLATQNPVDLDYKGLSNIGTWMIGRLQTDRDKARVLDGLESAGQGGPDRATIDRMLSGLTSRVFMMRNVHDTDITIFESRWAMSYLRGPLGRDEIRRLSAPQSAGVSLPSSEGAVSKPASAVATAAATRAAATGATTAAGAGGRPLLPHDVPQFFAPRLTAGVRLRPMVYAAADIRLNDRKHGVDTTKSVACCVGISDGPVAIDWNAGTVAPFQPDALAAEPPPGVSFEEVPPAAAKAKHYATWGRQFVDWVCVNEAVDLFRSPSTKLVSNVGESERDFRGRLQQQAREARDTAVEDLRRRYAPKVAALDERLRRAQQAVERESEQASGQRLQTYISMGATIAGALFGRKAASVSTLGRATTAARGMGRTSKEAKDVERAKESVAAIEEQRALLDEQLAADTAEIESRHDAALETLETVRIAPKKAGVSLKLVTLLWLDPQMLNPQM